LKNFCDLADLSADEIKLLLTKARWLEQQQSVPDLQGKVLALLFLNPSLRTMTSLQATMIRFGGGTFVVSPEMSIHGLETRAGIAMDGSAAEHIREAVPVIASYADAIGIRAIARKQNLEDDLNDTYFKELQDLCSMNTLTSPESTDSSTSVTFQGGFIPNIWVYKSLSRILRKVIYPLDQGKSLFL
jgi:N-acetylornithine carbamoyltransferase